MTPLKSATASSRASTAAAPSSADARHEIAKRGCWVDSVARSLSLLSRLGFTRFCCSLEARRLSASVGLGVLGGRGLEQRRTSAALVSQAGSGAENVAGRVSAAVGDGARGSVALCRQTGTCHSAGGFDWREKKKWLRAGCGCRTASGPARAAPRDGLQRRRTCSGVDRGWAFFRCVRVFSGGPGSGFGVGSGLGTRRRTRRPGRTRSWSRRPR